MAVEGGHRTRLRAILVVLALSTAAATALAAPATPLPPLPGPADVGAPRAGDAREANRSCEGCHQDVAAEWESSLHRRAWDDPVFQTAYVIEPQAFCRGCHAPASDPARVPTEGARRIGVGCVTCHGEGDAIAGPRSRAARPGAHAVRGDARLATSDACARCHDFAFPSPQAAPMQGTVSEHRASRFRDRPCASCHMPEVKDALGRSHRRHDFRVLGDVARLRSVVRATAARKGASALEVRLAAGEVGHALPTGDMFRRLEIRAEVVGTPAMAARPVVLARRFVVTRGADGTTQRRQVGDDRLSSDGAPRTVVLDFDGSIEGRAVRWTVAYQRMDERMAAAFGIDPRADETIVAEGTLGVAPGLASRGAGQ